MAIRTSASTTYLKRTTDLPNAATLSFCGWFRLTSDRNDYQNFFFSEHVGFGSQDIFLSTDSDGTTLKLFDGSASLTGANLTVGTWYFIGFARSNTSRILVYAPLGTAALTQATDSSTQTISATHSAIWGMTDVYNEWVDGSVAFMKLWSGVQLTIDDFARERWSILPRRTSSLYAFWPCFPGASLRLLDYSGNGRAWTGNGTLTDEDAPPVSWGRSGVRAIIPPAAAASQEIDLTGGAIASGTVPSPVVTSAVELVPTVIASGTIPSPVVTSAVELIPTAIPSGSVATPSVNLGDVELTPTVIASGTIPTPIVSSGAFTIIVAAIPSGSVATPVVTSAVELIPTVIASGTVSSPVVTSAVELVPTVIASGTIPTPFVSYTGNVVFSIEASVAAAVGVEASVAAAVGVDTSAKRANYVTMNVDPA